MIDRASGGLAASILLGAASAFAFEPVGWWPLMLLAFAALCRLIERAPSLGRALLLGWGFGVGQFVVGLNWIATAFTYQAKMPAWLGWVAVVLLALYLAVYPMLAAGLAWRWGRARPLALVLALSGGWAVTEWLRGTMFTGFAWNPVGVVFADTFVRDTSAWIGTYGLSALAVLVGGALFMAARRELKGAAALIAPLALLTGLAGQPRPGFTETRVRIVQPNIGQADKWRPGFDRIAADRLAGLTARPGGAAADIVLWPEAAVTRPLVDERLAASGLVEAERRRALRSIAPGQLLITGGLAFTSSDGLEVDGATNSVFVLARDRRVGGRYDKAHLVPYGEYLPMRPLLGAIGLSRLAPGDLDFRPGPGPRTLALPGGLKMGVQICYEIIFPGGVVEPGKRPDVLFNPSNDAWFGAWGPPQHLAQARLRAAEEGLPVLRSTPTGISAVIDARGALIASLGMGVAGVIDRPLPAALPPTPFARLGNVIPLTLAFLLVVAAIVLGRSPRYSADI